MRAVKLLSLLGIAGAVAFPQQSVSTVTSQGTPSATAEANPCAILSAQSVSQQSAKPTGISMLYKPSEVQACLYDIPINSTLAVEQITWIKNFVQFQSTLNYLKSPPPAYALPPVDVIGELDAISSKATAGKYRSEYEYELDISRIYHSADDGHFGYQPFLTYGTGYYPNHAFVSVSLDGKELPKVYILSDIQAKYSGNATCNISAVVAINGQNIEDYISQTSHLVHAQDLDAQYNIQFYNPATSLIVNGDPVNIPKLLRSSFNANDTNTFTFENGSTIRTAANATLLPPLAALGSGREIFDKFLVPVKSASTSTPATSSAIQSATSSATIAANSPVPLTSPGKGFPAPVMRNSENYLSGYFSNDSSTPDVAVLVISSFDAQDPISKEFQADVSNFLAKCKIANKKQLIIDVRGNPGGRIQLAYDTFKQLFPSIVPYSGNRMRVSKAAAIMGQLASQSSQAASGLLLTFFNALKNLQSPDGQPFGSWDQFYGPVNLRGDNFTHVAAKDFANATIDQAFDGIVVNGYADKKDIPASPFNSEDIILLTDGNCASTCAIFVNLLIKQGNVRTTTAGGRPSIEPMAIIGGVQGGEVLPYSDLKLQVQAALSELRNNPTTTGGAAASEAILEQILTPPSIQYFPSGPSQPSVNFLDSIAANDTTQTPLQFTRSPSAECRFFYTPFDIIDVEYTWRRIVKGFKNNGQGLCIGGIAGSSPTNGSIGGSSATTTSIATTPTGTNSQSTSFKGATSGMMNLRNGWAAAGIAGCAAYILMSMS